MKRKILLVVILLIALFTSTIVFATDDLEVKSNVNVNDFVGDNDVSVENTMLPTSEDEVVETSVKRGDLFILQDNASINNDVDGNVYVMADNVEIEGNIDGNVFAMGTNVTIRSNVSGSVFALAENVNFVCGEAKDVYFFGNDISIFDEAIISREAKMMAETIRISGSITGDLYSESERIKVTESGKIDGKLVYSGELYKENDEQIGSLEKYEVQKVELEEKNSLVAKTEKILVKTITALVITGLIVLILDKKIEGKITVADAVKGIIAGSLWIIVIPVILILLMITIIGLPISAILLMLYILMFFIAIPALSLQISAYILNIKNKESKMLLWLLAVVIYCAIAILREIPTLGTIITLLVVTYGFNLIIKTLFSKKKEKVA